MSDNIYFDWHCLTIVSNKSIYNTILKSFHCCIAIVIWQWGSFAYNWYLNVMLDIPSCSLHPYDNFILHNVVSFILPLRVMVCSIESDNCLFNHFISYYICIRTKPNIEQVWYNCFFLLQYTVFTVYFVVPLSEKNIRIYFIYFVDMFDV